jgi:hypothetical protein
MVLDWHACGLRSTARLRSRPAETSHSAAPAPGHSRNLSSFGSRLCRIRGENVTSVTRRQKRAIQKRPPRRWSGDLRPETTGGSRLPSGLHILQAELDGFANVVPRLRRGTGPAPYGDRRREEVTRGQAGGS